MALLCLVTPRVYESERVRYYIFFGGKRDMHDRCKRPWLLERIFPWHSRCFYPIRWLASPFWGLTYKVIDNDVMYYDKTHRIRLIILDTCVFIA